MPEKRDTRATIPEGAAFLQFESQWQNECADQTSRLLAETGSKALKLVEGIGTLLSLLYRLSTCHWGCKGNPHTVEHLVGRVVNQSLSAWRLSQFGFYDEALSLVRTAGEIGNLLCVFLGNRELLKEWGEANEKKRRTEFSPINVRLKLEKLGAPIPVNETRYRTLSQSSTHPSPTVGPQSRYTPTGQSFIGGSVQIAGFLITLNEISFVLIPVGLFAGALLQPAKPVRGKIEQTCRTLYDNLGGIDVVNVSTWWEKLRNPDIPGR